MLNLGAKVMIPGFTLKHPDGRQAILEIVGFWTPEYLDKKLEKIQNADLDHLLVAVSERLECSADDFEGEVTVSSGSSREFTSTISWIGRRTGCRDA